MDIEKVIDLRKQCAHQFGLHVKHGGESCGLCRDYEGRLAAFDLIIESADAETWPECRRFYELMQRYRHLPVSCLGDVKWAYEEVKSWLRQNRYTTSDRT